MISALSNSLGNSTKPAQINALKWSFMSAIHCSALSECISAVETFFVTSHKASSARDNMQRTLCHYTFMHCVTAPTFHAHFYHEVPLKKGALIFLFSTKH